MSQSMTQSSSYASQKATAADLSIFEKLDLLPAVAVSCTSSSLVSGERERESTQRNRGSIYIYIDIYGFLLTPGIYRGECICGNLHRGLQTQEPETVVLLSICESHVSEDHHEENDGETAAVGFSLLLTSGI